MVEFIAIICDQLKFAFTSTRMHFIDAKAMKTKEIFFTLRTRELNHISTGYGFNIKWFWLFNVCCFLLQTFVWPHP